MTTTFLPGPSTTAVPAFLMSEGDLLLHNDGATSVVTWVGNYGERTRICFLPQGASLVREMTVPALRDMKVLNP